MAFVWLPCWKRTVQVGYREQEPGERHVSTREGITPLKPDDLIMRGAQGEEYPIGRDIFDATYTTEPPPSVATARAEAYEDAARLVHKLAYEVARKRPGDNEADAFEAPIAAANLRAAARAIGARAAEVAAQNDKEG